MEFHALANCFPLMEGAEFDDLVASIRDRGQIDPIITFEDKILDGRNRFRACEQADVEPYFSNFEGPFEEARNFVMDANLRRRHLDASQRSMVAAKLATMKHGGDRVSEQAANLPVPTQAEAAERLNVSERSVRDARRVLDHGSPELVADVESGKVAVSTAARAVLRGFADHGRVPDDRPPLPEESDYGEETTRRGGQRAVVTKLLRRIEYRDILAWLADAPDPWRRQLADAAFEAIATDAQRLAHDAKVRAWLAEYEQQERA